MASNGKLPWFQFYPADWLQDTRMLDLQSKGAWFEIINAMWVAPDRGVLSGTVEEFSLLLGCETTVTSALLDRFERLKICDVERAEHNGNAIVTLKCRRMVREETERRMNANRVAKFREKKACNANVTPTLPLFDDNHENAPCNNDVTPEENDDFPFGDGTSDNACNGYVTPHVMPYISEVRSQNPPIVPRNGDGLNGNGNHDPPEFERLRLRIGSWFHRRPTNRWSDKERKALKGIFPVPEDDLRDLEEFYIKSGDKYLRHDVPQLLNNFNGELDRARAYIASRSKPKPVTKSVIR